jgi:hypothetical protein
MAVDLLLDAQQHLAFHAQSPICLTNHCCYLTLTQVGYEATLEPLRQWKQQRFPA